MINLDRLIYVLSNFKEKKYKLPEGNKFTQKSAYQMKVSDLENLVCNDVSQLNDYVDKTMNITSQKGTRSSNYNQSHNHSSNSSSTSTSDNKQLITNDNSIIFSQDEILNIPHILEPIFQSLNKDNYYVYGIKNNNSFFNSLVLLTQKDYIIKSKSEKSGCVSSFKRELGLKVETNFNDYDYKELGFKKSDMITNLIDNLPINFQVKMAAIDFIKKNVCIININKKTYVFLENYNDNSVDDDDNTLSFYILIQINDIYIPILNTDGIHHFNKDLLEIIKRQFEKDIDNKNRIIKNNKELNLKSLSSYKLKELQELSVKHSINIKKIVKDKEKNKTKEELYNELKMI